MASEKSQPEKQPSSAAVNSHTSSCRKTKSENATFFEDVKDHIDDFIHASMEDHKNCFKKGIEKMFRMSKGAPETSSEVKEVESFLHLQTSVNE
ncbi:hypothetical protein ACH5RR_040041 [Cinchona calisaya]|uniref:Uncharacterized protein n=1 Tax=Cinchona calisaya TaxID=153742 RepID=A0ABD2XRF3_9GENT